MSSGHRNSAFCMKYGPWALVTGASSGIGRSIAEQLAEAGMNLVLVARSGDVLSKLIDEWVPKYGVSIRAVPIDLASDQSLAGIVQATGDLDIGLLVLAAGFGSGGLFHELPIANELDMLAVNTRSVLELTRHYLPSMVQKKRGGAVLLSSIVAFQGMPYSAQYAATKSYVQSLAEGLAIELRPFGVDVLSVAPGPTHSGFAQRAGLVMGKAADPSTVAKSVIATLGQRTTVLPGFLAKLLRYSMTGLPRWAKVRIMGAVMKGMLAKQ